MSTFGRSPASPIGDSVPPPPLNPHPAATVTEASLGRRDLDGAEASFRKAYEIDRTFGETHGALAVIGSCGGRGRSGHPARVLPGSGGGAAPATPRAGAADPPPP